MGKAPCCEKVGLKRGRWTAKEDDTLIKYIQANGEGSWKSLPKNAGLLRCGKSCRLRWINYLRGDLKRGNISREEDEKIIKLHKAFGNRWSMIASHLPGRTDNEIKNYWNTHLSRQTYRFFTRTNSETQTSTDVATLVNQKKQRTGRVSRNVAKKYNQNRYFKNTKSSPLSTTNKSTPQAMMDKKVDQTENQVCHNVISDELWLNLFGVQDDELIDIDYFLESESMDSSGIFAESGVQNHNNTDGNGDETVDENLKNFSKTMGFGFDEIEWDTEFDFSGSMFDEGDEMSVWLWENGHSNVQQF